MDQSLMDPNDQEGMPLKKVLRVVNTVKYLRFVQVYYRFFYLLRTKFVKKQYKARYPLTSNPIMFNNMIINPPSYKGQKSFIFLNLPHTFKNIDWNFNAKC